MFVGGHAKITHRDLLLHTAASTEGLLDPTKEVGEDTQLSRDSSIGIREMQHTVRLLRSRWIVVCYRYP